MTQAGADRLDALAAADEQAGVRVKQFTGAERCQTRMAVPPPGGDRRHSIRGITYRHYAYRAPPAFRAIMTLPQPAAFPSLVKGFDGECPCCRKRFVDAA